MILVINDKFDVSPEWFEKQSGLDRWHEWHCQQLSVYKVLDEASAKVAAEKKIAAGDSKELVKAMLE